MKEDFKNQKVTDNRQSPRAKERRNRPGRMRTNEQGARLTHSRRTRTLTVVRGLDEMRKGMVVDFLHESGLIAKERVIELSGADLSGANLNGAKVSDEQLAKVKSLKYATLPDGTIHG